VCFITAAEFETACMGQNNYNQQEGGRKLMIVDFSKIE